jgi:hypothetical protein
VFDIEYSFWPKLYIEWSQFLQFAREGRPDTPQNDEMTRSLLLEIELLCKLICVDPDQIEIIETEANYSKANCDQSSDHGAISEVNGSYTFDHLLNTIIYFGAKMSGSTMGSILSAIMALYRARYNTVVTVLQSYSPEHIF